MPLQQENVFNQEAIKDFFGAPEPSMPQPSPTLTFGQKLVGLAFNPSNDNKVDKAKRLFAEIADLLNDDRQGRETTQLDSILFPHTIGEILNAQMNVVKVLTLKY